MLHPVRTKLVALYLHASPSQDETRGTLSTCFTQSGRNSWHSVYMLHPVRTKLVALCLHASPSQDETRGTLSTCFTQSGRNSWHSIYMLHPVRTKLVALLTKPDAYVNSRISFLFLFLFWYIVLCQQNKNRVISTMTEIRKA